MPDPSSLDPTSEKARPGRPTISRLSPAERRAASVSRDSLVEARPLLEGGSLPLLVEPAAGPLHLLTWMRENQPRVEGWLHREGGILLRGFELGGLEEVEQVIQASAGGVGLLEYTYRSTPRSQVKGNLYTSTEYPEDQSIPMHNENSYSAQWPMKIGFYCHTAAPEGGETPIADSRRVLAELSPELVERFERLGVLYVRNYGSQVDLPWRDVFQTDDRSKVEAFCQQHDIELEWGEGDRLRTRQVCRAVARHPVTGERVWFNQAHLFHVSSLPEEIAEYLVMAFGEENLPRNTYYGDGTPIEAETLAEIRAAFERCSVAFPWQEGDVLLLDNMLVAHGRRPYKGPRRIIVGMAEGCDDAALARAAGA